jgi:hypothetical protein
LVGSYVVNVGEIPVHPVGQVKDALSADRPTQVVLTLAPEPRSDNDFRQPPLHLQLDQLLRVHSLQSTSEQEKTPKDYKSEVISNAEAISSDHVSDFKTRHLISRLIHEEIVGRKQAGLYALDDDGAVDIVSRVISENMTMEEHKLSSFTRRNLKKLPVDQWGVWREAYFTPLDSHRKDQVLGEPCRRPAGAIVLRAH